MRDVPKYSITVPVYNEEPNLAALYGRIRPVADALTGACEIIFVNDGSMDGSRSLLEGISRRDGSVVVVNFTRNFGQHPAMVAGILQARGEFIITLDADLQNPPEEIPRLVDEIDKGYDMVSGKRSNRKDNVFRMVPSFAVNVLISMMTGVWMEDYGSGLRVFRADTAKKLAEAFFERQAYLSMLVPKVTKNVKEIEVSHDERFSGPSKYGLWKLLSTFFRIFFARSGKGISGVQDVFSIESVIRNGEKT